jgi:putative membrane protein
MKLRPILAAPAFLLAMGACGDRSTDTGEAGVENRLAADEPVTNNVAELVPVAANPIEYANLASASDLYEVESARLALEKSENARVRELAQAILADHQRSTEQLRAIAGEAQPPVTVAPRMDPEQQANLDALRRADGADFDRQYLLQQVAAHEKAFAMTNDYAQNGEDAAMRQHASTVAGPIQQHLARARELAEGMAQR